MTLWFDLSTSLGSTGMSGTVRTELEVCRGLQRRTSGKGSLKFFRYKEGKIVPVDATTVPWLVESSQPIGDAYLAWIHAKKAKETGDEREDHLQRLLKFAQHTAPHPLDRGRHSVMLALSLLPPPVVEAILEALGPHSNATFQLMQRVAGLMTKNTAAPPPPPVENPKSPFSPGDSVFSLGIDWELTYLPLLKKIREKTPIKVHHVVHDLTPIVTPQFHVVENCDAYRSFFFNVSTIADTAWYISEQTRIDAEHTQKAWRLPIVPSRQVRWGSVPPRPTTVTREQRKATLAARGVTRPFFLFVSTVEARKNHETIYRAYRQLLKERGPEIPQLVFVGHGGWKRSEFLGWLHRDPVVKGHLKHFSANDAELDALYRECLFTVYPSHYEGWGLPIVESHAYGKAVIISDSPSLQEAAGEGVDAVDAISVKAWRDVLAKYLFEPEHLAHVTQRQLKHFAPISWEQTAEQILAGVESDASRLAAPGSAETERRAEMRGRP